MRFLKAGRFLGFERPVLGYVGVEVGVGFVPLALLLNCATDNDGVNVAISCCMDELDDWAWRAGCGEKDLQTLRLL